MPKFKPASFGRVAFEPSSFEAPDDPLSTIAYKGDPEADHAAELAVAQNSFADRAKAEEARRKKATDSEYWVCLCFQNRDQVMAFIAALGLSPDAKYVDGVAVANKLKLPIPEDALGYSKSKIDPTWAALARDDQRGPVKKSKAVETSKKSN